LVHESALFILEAKREAAGQLAQNQANLDCCQIVCMHVVRSW